MCPVNIVSSISKTNGDLRKEKSCFDVLYENTEKLLKKKIENAMKLYNTCIILILEQILHNFCCMNLFIYF